VTDHEDFQSDEQRPSRFGIVSRLLQRRAPESESQPNRSYWSRWHRAGWIQTRRGGLRLKMWLQSGTANNETSRRAGVQRGRLVSSLRRQCQSLFESLPVWTCGAVAGVIGALLAISLFFLPDSPVVATPAEEVIPEPGAPLLDPFDEFEFEPTPAPPPAPQPRLVSLLERTTLPRSWNQNEAVTLHARPFKDTDSILPRSLADDWNHRTPFGRGTETFRPYVAGAATTLPPTSVSAADAVDSDLPQSSTRTTGLTVEKSAPESGSPGEPVRYRILVTNPNPEAVESVIVRERLSAVERVQQVEPPAVMIDGELVWTLGRLEARQQRELTVLLLPSDPGEIETETRVEVVSPLPAWARVDPEQRPAEPESEPEDEVLPALPEMQLDLSETNDAAPRPFPELKLSVTPVGVLQQGETLTLTFTITNTGTATAEDVTLYVNLSGPIQHRFGESVQHHVTKLEPGESRQAVLRAAARSSGDARLGASLTLGGNEEETQELTVPIRGGQEAVSSSPFFESTTPTPDGFAQNVERAGRMEWSRAR
jgi:hypothetical protein